jgi:hypothetical protein
MYDNISFSVISTFVRDKRWSWSVKYIVTFRGFCVTYKIDFGLAEKIYCTLHIQNSGLQIIQRYRYSTHFAVHRYTRITILSFHQMPAGNGFITVSLALQIKRGLLCIV